MLARYMFYPGVWALVFLVMFLILLSMLGRPSRAPVETSQERVLMFLLLGATAITHLMTATALFSVLAGVSLVRSLQSARTRAVCVLFSASTLAVLLVVPLSWDIYWATRVFEGVTRAIVAVMRDISGKGLLVYFFNLAGSYTGEGVPLWAVLVRYFWWGVIFLFGTIIGLRNLLGIKGLSWTSQLETGGLVGVIALSATASLLSVGGAEFFRFLLYGAFFTVPIGLRFLLSLPRNKARLALAITVASFFILSFPTFLAHNNLVGTSTYYPSELQVGAFLERIYGNGEGLKIFDSYVRSPLLLYVPDADFRVARQASELKGPEEFWSSLGALIAQYLEAPSGYLFGFSERAKAMNEHFFRIAPTDMGWRKAVDRLSATGRIYDDATIQLYMKWVD